MEDFISGIWIRENTECENLAKILHLLDYNFLTIKGITNLELKLYCHFENDIFNLSITNKELSLSKACMKTEVNRAEKKCSSKDVLLD